MRYKGKLNRLNKKCIKMCKQIRKSCYKFYKTSKYIHCKIQYPSRIRVRKIFNEKDKGRG